LLLLRRSLAFDFSAAIIIVVVVVVVVAIFDVDFFSAILDTFFVDTAILPAADRDDDDDEDEGRDENEDAEDGSTSEQFSSEVVGLISLRFSPGFDGSFIRVLVA
jgi:hypothetical protein